MGDYERSTTVDIPADVLFGYLSDVEHLPAYLPRLTSVTSLGDGQVEVTAHIHPPDGPEQDVKGEAWLRVREQGQTLEWGAAGPHDYRGELDVDPADDARSRLTVRLHTERSDGESIEASLEETLAGIKRVAEEASRS